MSKSYVEKSEKRNRFIFITCQIGAEQAIKWEISQIWPDFRFAYSRPGFLTFKLPETQRLPSNFDLKAVFARSYGFSCGKLEGKPSEKLAAEAWQMLGRRTVQRIHVWPRDIRPAGEGGYEPGITDEALEVHKLLVNACPDRTALARNAQNPLAPARKGEMVLDCILLDQDCWWIGYHRVERIESRYPGGMMSLKLPSDAVSRAWLKMEEALRWSELPIPQGAQVAEIGSAPGGASQALLSHGFFVTGIDPAEMSPVVLAHPRFRHIRRRSTQVRRREFRKIRWLTADMNVAPNYTLDAVEDIVCRDDIHIRGMLLTLKLPDWKLAAHVPEYIERIKSWGYNIVRARQLQYNRREICVAALQKPFRRK